VFLAVWNWNSNLESFSELTRHAAVNGEIEWIRQADEEVNEGDQRVDNLVVEGTQFETIIYDVEDVDGSHRNLDQQENGYNDDEHERGAVRVAQFAALALLLVLFEEFVAFLLGSAEGAEQQHVQHN